MLTPLINLITTTPGNLVYHLVLTFAAAAGLQGIILHQDAHSRTRGRRLLLALGIVLACQLILFAASGLTGPNVDWGYYLPPLDRALAAISLVWIAWIWVFPDPQPRVDSNISILNLVLVIFFFASLMGRTAGDAVNFNATLFNQLWAAVLLVICAAAMVLLVLRRPETWVMGLIFMSINLLGAAAHLAFGVQEQDYAGLIRLAQLASYPLLPSLARRLQSGRKAGLPGGVSPADEFKGWLELAASPGTALPVLLRKLAEAHGADAACLVNSAGTGVRLVHGLDLKRGVSLRELDLQYGQVPALSDALQQAHPLRLAENGAPTPDLETWSTLLGAQPVKQLMAVPLNLAESPLAGLVLLSFNALPAWDEQKLEDFEAFSEPVGTYLSGQAAPPPGQLQQELEATRTALQQLQAEYDRLKEQPAASPELVAELEAVLARQQETQAAMQLLEEENRQLLEMIERARAESAQPSQDVEALTAELHAAQMETARLRARLSEAGQAIADLQRRLEQQPGGQPVFADPSLLNSLNGILHDLRQPLSAVIGYTDMLLEQSVGTLGALQQRFLQRIRTSSERMDIALNDLVQLRSLQQEPPASPGPVDLISVVDQLLAEMRPSIQARQLSLSIDLHADLPPVRCERNALRQVLTHLLWNAREVTPAGGQLAVQGCIERDPGTGAWVELRVTDQGGGVPQALLPHLFDPDYRADQPVIPGLAESAFGLWLSRTLIHAAGGQIWAESHDGGTTFILRLPATTRMTGSSA